VSRLADSPYECPHQDVLVAVEMTAARWQGTPPDPLALVQRGRCDACGAQVMRRGRHDAWNGWRVEPPQRHRWGSSPR
jgi:hypothetical protein